MPRKARLSPPGTFFHIMARGIEGRDIYCDDSDRSTFLSLIGNGLRRTGFKCYAWVLMTNHYHLLLRINHLHLSELMRPLNGAYARYFSKKYDRRGYLFQDRYKSLVTQDQRFVEEGVRYIHLNPLRAGICKTYNDLLRFRWSGHAELMGTIDAGLLDTWTVLQRFGSTIQSGRDGYSEFLSQAISSKELSMPGLAIRSNSNTRDLRRPASYVIGDQSFVKKTLENERARHLRIARHHLENISIDEIADKTARAAGISVETLLRRARGNWNSKVRKVFAYLCYREFGIAIVAIADYLDVAQSAISLAVRQGEELVKNNEFITILNALHP